ncbi:hypothetical protein BYT27DRAFT_7219571 [Phlegmacium glaucopus]|nr:hypothetical protein BYT27DRAFT_7219571 [Phlegmacium glaucopus]
MKMRCDPVSDEEEQTVEVKARIIKPAPSKKLAAKMAGPSKKPAPAPTLKPALAKAPASAPKSRRAPAAGSKKKKVVKSAEVVYSGDEESAGASTRHPQHRTFGDLERQDDIEELSFLVTDFRNELVACLKDVMTLEERMDNAFILVDTWLMKNVDAEGEVTALSRRVEAQDTEMDDLRQRLA